MLFWIKRLHIICTVVLVLTILTVGSIYVYRHSPRLRQWIRNERSLLTLHRHHYTLPDGKCFDDLQDIQLEAATRNGIKPLDNEKKIQRLVHDGVLEEISENATYKVDHLTHSYPYLVPKAVMLLEDIGELTQSLGKSRSRIIVTSGLRTKEMIEKLSRCNRNATQNSCHLYGTTFDISYIRFDESCFFEKTDISQALHDALEKLHDQGRCYVKTEKKQHCYHVTVK